MESKNKSLLILIALFMGMVEVANAFYDPGLQRWLNRDPIGEWGGPDLYSFTGNEPSDVADAFGFYKIDGNKIYVEPCEIVIAYGDQPGKSKPLEFVFPKGKTCAGGAVVCWPDLTNKKVPKANQIPNSPDHGEQIVWPAKNPTDTSKQTIAEHPEWGDGPKELEEIEKGAIAKAKTMKNCDSVAIRFYKTPGGQLKTGIPEKPEDIIISPPLPLPNRPPRMR